MSALHHLILFDIHVMCFHNVCINCWLMRSQWPLTTKFLIWTKGEQNDKIVINSLNAFMRYHVHKSGTDNEMMPLAKDISSAEALQKKTCSVKETAFTKALNKLTTLCFMSGGKSNFKKLFLWGVKRSKSQQKSTATYRPTVVLAAH